MNDLVSMKRLYGDKLAFTIHLDYNMLNDPNVTEDQIVKAVREAIDTYGEGGGMVLMSMGFNEFVASTIIRETFEYSRKKYAGN